MTIDQLRNECEHHKALGMSRIVLAAKRFPRKDFPRGQLLCVNAKGEQVRMFKIDALLKVCQLVLRDKLTGETNVDNQQSAVE